MAFKALRCGVYREKVQHRYMERWLCPVVKELGVLWLHRDGEANTEPWRINGEWITKVQEYKNEVSASNPLPPQDERSAVSDVLSNRCSHVGRLQCVYTNRFLSRMQIRNAHVYFSGSYPHAREASRGERSPRYSFPCPQTASYIFLERIDESIYKSLQTQKILVTLCITFY